ncbi:MAG: hypothetical protein BXU00_02775 [Candidatus Nanoclepta minutus]|uniref:Metal-dependent hydrolase n=1 Tax=Candidatus Nanoclepta minutus TaxID=1940235 RepID=A0A397WRD6_9ARCH|nr:MAG: hypothetical protein BXU00_02775 [Candidatus Nanoclepta minutus]
MIGRLHFSTSLLLSYLIYGFLGFDKVSSIVLSIITASISSLPDFDYKIFSWANKKKILFEKTGLKYILFPIYLLILLLIKLFRHRGITHSIFPIIIFFYLSIFFRPFLILSISFLLHSIEDSFTVSGIYPLYPVRDIQLKIPILSNKQRRLQSILSYLFIFIFFLLIL